MLLDLGCGALGPLQRYGVPPTIDGVCFSHLHPDHFLDLTGSTCCASTTPAARSPASRLGPEGVARGVAPAYGLPEDPGMSRVVRVPGYADAVDLGPLSTPHAVDHPVQAFGFQVTAGGRTLGYSGDTGRVQGVEEVARGAICCWPRPRSATARTTPRTST